MNGVLVLSICLVALATVDAGMPFELSKILGLTDSEKLNPATNSVDLANTEEELKNAPGTFLGKFGEIELDKSTSEYPSRKESIETARRRLVSGDISHYLPHPIQKVECHVEFQVTERVPGRCTKLGGSIPACQTEKYIGINYSECS